MVLCKINKVQICFMEWGGKPNTHALTEELMAVDGCGDKGCTFSLVGHIDRLPTFR